MLDNCGVYLGSASVPYPVTVTEVGPAGVIHVVASDQLDIEFVVRLRLDTEVRERSCQPGGINSTVPAYAGGHRPDAGTLRRLAEPEETR